MIRIGKLYLGTVDSRRDRTLLENYGTIVFEGNANIGRASKISCGKNGLLSFGNEFTLIGRSEILCQKSITFKANCLLSWDILIMYTDWHNIYPFNNPTERLNPNKSVTVGENVWIGCRSIILKGVKVPDGTIIAAGSRLTHSIETTKNSIISENIEIKTLRQNIIWRK